MRLERFCDVRIVDETNGFGPNLVKKTENGFRSSTPGMGALLKRRTDLGLAYSWFFFIESFPQICFQRK